MTERQAHADGLCYTGTYVRSYEADKAKAAAKQIRDMGFRAVVVTIPDH